MDISFNYKIIVIPDLLALPKPRICGAKEGSGIQILFSKS